MARITLSWGVDGEKGGYLVDFPVLPEEISVKCNIKNDSVNINGLGETTIFQEPGPATYEFESHFPANWFPGCAQDLKNPRFYNDLILSLIKAKTPAKLDVDCAGVAVANELVSIDSYEYSERGGTVGDIYFSITLKKYIAIKTDSPKTPTSYTVKKGDTFQSISKKYYGITSMKSKLASFNNMKLGQKLKPGVKIKFP